MAPLDNNDFAVIPRWPLVAFIARSARRLLPLYEQDNAEPVDQRMVVARAILLAEKRAAMGGASDAHDYERALPPRLSASRISTGGRLSET